MFGDKIIAGQFQSIVSDKHRIFLPAKTNREKDDVIFLVYDSHLEHYKLYPAKVIKLEFERYNKLIEEAKNIEDLELYKKMLFEFSKSIIKECKVDSLGRIILTDDFVQNDEINMIGSGNHLVLIHSKKNQQN